MPDHINSNYYNIRANECFETTDGQKLKGPYPTVRITEYPDMRLIAVQGPDGEHWEIRAISIDEAFNPC